MTFEEEVEAIRQRIAQEPKPQKRQQLQQVQQFRQAQRSRQAKEEMDKRTRESLLEVAEKLGRTPTRGEYIQAREPGMPHQDVLWHRYGQWKDVLAVAGLEPPEKAPRKRKKVKSQQERQKMICDLQVEAALLGRSPRRSEWMRNARANGHRVACVQTYLKEFGPTWNDVLRAADLPEVEEWPMVE